MKTKTKVIVLVEMAVVLCSVFLVATLPAIAAEQVVTQEVSAAKVTTASEDDYVLGVYGNANEDDTIDMGDVVYTKLAIFGKKPKTELCDAKYDGRINVLDVIQTKLIILGKEKELTIVDSADRIVTVKKPIKKIIPISSYVIEIMRSLKAVDKIVAVFSVVVNENIFFPNLCDLPNIGDWRPPYDYEMIAELQPDLVFLYAGGTYDKAADKIESIVPGVTVVRSTPGGFLGCKKEVYTDEIKKLGYILDREDEAEEFLDWYEGWLSKIKERTAKLSEDEKPKVFFIVFIGYLPSKCYTVNRLSVAHDMIVDAGGINIAADLAVGEKSFMIVDPEWVIKQNPEIIIAGRSSVMGYKMDKPTGVEMEEERDKVLNQPGWGHITAVKERSVYTTAIRLRKGPAIITAYQAKLFHPDLFEDLDPQAIHQEYIDRFCPGLDFDVKKDGVFIYPPLEES